MMKKLYACLSVIVLFLGFNTLQAQVIVVEDFEDGALITDFPGWSSSLPGFNPTVDTPCEGLQSVQSNLHSGNLDDYIQFLSEVTSGSDLLITFDLKIVDLNGTLTSGNFGTIDLSYTVDNGATWTVYETIDQTDLPLDCVTQTFTIPAASVPAGSDFGWKLFATWNAGDYYVYVDDFKAVEQVPCIQPVNVEVDPTSITFDEAIVSWDDLNASPAASYLVAYCTSQGDPGDGQFPTGTGNPTCLANSWLSVTGATTTPLTGLQDGTEYFVYVRAVCGPSDESAWSLATSFQTIAIGTDCSVPIEVDGDTTTPAVSELPYTHTSSTDIYGADEYSGAGGANCGSAGNLLDGYEVVYHYVSSIDDILTIDVTGLTAQDVGVFVYEDCGDIGNFCIGGAATTTGGNLNVNSLFVTGGEDYYIVIASIDGATGDPINTDYTLNINGFDCASWVVPDLPPSGAPIPFVAGAQDLSDFSHTLGGIQPTIDGATLSWYYDNNGAQGALITAPLNTIVIADLDCFWVTQNVGTCESPALQVCFDEFNCSTDLGGITGTTGDSVCDFGAMSLTATAGTTNLYWYANPTGGEPIGAGNQFDTPDLTQTTSYWVSEVFVGQGVIDHQGNPGPTSSTSSGDNDEGVTFTTNQPMVIKEVQVFVTSGGNSITLQLEDASGVIKGPQIFAVNGGSTTSPTANTIVLDWMVPTSGTYSLVKTAGASMLIESSPTYPYPLGTAGEIISSGSDYYYFFDWTITGPEALCESPRQQVTATVHETKSTTVSADEMIVCIGSTTNLHVTSPNPDYVYTWTWTDATGQSQTATGADIPVTLNQNNTFYVNAFDPNTTCFFDNEISLEVKGAADLALTPDQELCLGETRELTAGGLVFNFENTTTGWTTANNSTPGQQGTRASADWRLANSPDQLTGGTSSNDDSQFYISMANLLGPTGSVDAELISPVISMVGVGSASMSFYHYFRYTQRHNTTGAVQVTTDLGPNPTWVDLQTYSDNVGEYDAFVKQTIDLTPYVGSQIKIRFHHTGGWGWYWAIDNVVFTRNFLSGSVSWSPMTDLYFDEQGMVPYTGTPTNTVYFKGSQAGSFTYTANLVIPNCSASTATINVDVYETAAPTGPAQQTFLMGEVLSDLTVTGQNLGWYVIDANGDYDKISPNTQMVNGTTYYVTQTMNNCESEPLLITVDQECVAPSNVSITQPAVSANGLASIIVDWQAPADLAGVLEYHIKVTDITDLNNLVVVFDEDVPIVKNFAIVKDLELEREFKLELYSVCDPTNMVFGAVGEEFFDTIGLGVNDVSFGSLTYYPNPTQGMVQFENQLPIEKITVYSITGQRILEKKVAATKVKMDFGHLASGTYMVAIQVGGAMKVVQIIRE